MIEVRASSPHEAGAAALLQQSHALMQALFQPEENHFLSLDALTAPDIRFFTARDGDNILGTAALRHCDGYGEIKSMFVAPTARGRGVAALLLDRLEAEARVLGLSLLRLETGDKLAEAHRLYTRAGFVPRTAFGSYTANATSIFMEKPLV